MKLLINKVRVCATLKNKIIKSIIILITIITFSLFTFNFNISVLLSEHLVACLPYALPMDAGPKIGQNSSTIFRIASEAMLRLCEATWFDNINYNSILIKISKFCFWFSLGIKIYLQISFPFTASVSAKRYGNIFTSVVGNLRLSLHNFINKLTFLQLTLILFTVFYIISVIMDILIINIINEYYINYIDSLNDLYMTDNQNKTSSKTNLNTSNSTGDSAIIAASMAAGTKLAQKAPSIEQKALILSSATAIGLGAIGVINVVIDVAENLGKNSNKLLPFNPINDLDISKILGLTGNSAFDLIKMINYFQTIQLIVSIFMIYNLFFYIIDFTYVITKLNKMFPGPVGQKYVLIFSNYISKIKKFSLIFLTLFTILNLICAYVNSNTIEFVYTNFDSIIELYVKNKNN